MNIKILGGDGLDFIGKCLNLFLKIDIVIYVYDDS